MLSVPSLRVFQYRYSQSLSLENALDTGGAQLTRGSRVLVSERACAFKTQSLVVG